MIMRFLLLTRPALWAALPAALEAANVSGPALTFLGLAPRAALAAAPSLNVTTLKLEEFA